MPLPSIVTAIISSVIQSAAEQASTLPAQPYGPMVGQVRTLPPAAKLGEMAPPWMGAVQIDGQVIPLAPGAQIRNEMNMIMMPSAIQQPVRVRYLIDASGAVWRVWILTPAELAAAESR